ncbi:hypothetical protein AOA57_30265 [Pseudomonas sp. 2588-5]|nr:hypothetical protein AOA57_30265 [Pseudomonas sp. 2588-5]
MTLKQWDITLLLHLLNLRVTPYQQKAQNHTSRASFQTYYDQKHLCGSAASPSSIGPNTLINVSLAAETKKAPF